MRLSVLTAALGALAFALACGDSSGPRAGLNILSGDNLSDTVGSTLTPPLTVELLDGNNEPISGQTVYFGSGTVLLAPIGDPGSVTDRLPVVTNGGGQAAVLVEFTYSAGLGNVVITAPNGQSVKAHFTVLPGAPAFVRADPSDTVLYVGGAETFRPFITDAYGNRRPDMPVYQYQSLNAALIINSPGKATGATIGRGLVAVSALGFTDTVRTSVVPPGRIAAQTTGAPYVISMNLNGSGADSLIIEPPPRSMDWSSVIRTFVVEISGGADYLAAMDTLGHLRRIVTDSLMRSEWYPRYSPDGSYIYFTGNDSASTCYGVWRVRQDGTALQQMVADTLDCGQYAYINGPAPDYASSPSPDGTQLVYVSRALRIRTLATGVDTNLGVVGDVPRWSPAGGWIAYDSLGTLLLIHPDGTGHQTLADRQDDLYPSDLFTWSPDGQWLLYHTSDRLVLVQVATGLQLPLSVTIGLFDPVWLR